MAGVLEVFFYYFLQKIQNGELERLFVCQMAACNAILSVISRNYVKFPLK